MLFDIIKNVYIFFFIRWCTLNAVIWFWLSLLCAFFFLNKLIDKLILVCPLKTKRVPAPFSPYFLSSFV